MEKAKTKPKAKAKAKVKAKAENKKPAAKEKAPTSDETRISQSKATRMSWKDPAVRAKRTERTKVRVGGVEYKSTEAAMVALKLPTNNVIKFRMELKESGRKTYSHNGTDYIFTVVN